MIPWWNSYSDLALRYSILLTGINSKLIFYHSYHNRLWFVCVCWLCVCVICVCADCVSVWVLTSQRSLYITSAYTCCAHSATSMLALRARIRCSRYAVVCDATRQINIIKKIKTNPRPGFEPTTFGLQVRCSNHWAKEPSLWVGLG